MSKAKAKLTGGSSAAQPAALLRCTVPYSTLRLSPDTTACTELTDEATRDEKMVCRLTGEMVCTAWPALPYHSLPMKLRS